LRTPAIRAAVIERLGGALDRVAIHTTFGREHCHASVSQADRKRLTERSDAEMRSLSNYLAVLILEDLKRRR
jgi:hypothetical protein